MLALIDGDVVLYQVGFACQKKYWVCNDGQADIRVETKKEAMAYDSVTEHMHVEDITWALHSVRMMLDRIMLEADCSGRRTYLTGKGNYREGIYPDYKANRKDKPKPVLYGEIRQYMIDYLEAVVVDGQEADDELGIQQYGDETVICTIDKDLLMIPGQHYNWRKPERGVVHVTGKEGRHWFFTQVLMGDAVDNIPGLKGIGPKKAEGILCGCHTTNDYMLAVQDAYAEHRDYTDTPMDKLHVTIETIANLLLIRTKVNQAWWKLHCTTGVTVD